MSTSMLKDTLTKKGYTGQMNDALAAWAKDKTGDTGHVNELMFDVSELLNTGGISNLLNKYKELFKDELIGVLDFSNTNFWTGAYTPTTSGLGVFETTGGGQGPRTKDHAVIESGKSYKVVVNELSSGVTVNWRTSESGVNKLVFTDNTSSFEVPSGDTGVQLYIRASSAGTHTAVISVKEE